MATIILNSQTVTYTNIYYISAIGNDSTGDGTKAKPFLTYDKALSKTTNGDLIYFIKGNYNITNLTAISYGSAYIYDNGKQLTIYSEPYTYITINNPSNSARDTHAICISNSNTKVIGFTIDYNVTDRSNSYSRSIFGAVDAGYLNGYIYNCHFIIRSATSFSYANSGNSLKCINCQFDIKTTMESSYSGSTSFNYCTFNLPQSGVSSSGFINLGNNIFSISYDINYTPTPFNKDYGVYFGLYVWKVIKYLIQDGTIVTRSIDGVSTNNVGTTPFDKSIFDNYGMYGLSNINSVVISKLINNKFKVAIYKK